MSYATTEGGKNIAGRAGPDKAPQTRCAAPIRRQPVPLSRSDTTLAGIPLQGLLKPGLFWSPGLTRRRGILSFRPDVAARRMLAGDVRMTDRVSQ